MKIAIIGPPGSGKTTLAADLFVHLKKMKYNVEFIPELVKLKVYRGQDFSKPGFDINNAWEQMALEDSLKKTKFDFIIFEAPLCNGYFYTSFYRKLKEAVMLEDIAKKYINGYDVVIHLRVCDEAEYESFGRNESYHQVVALDNLIDEIFKSLDYKNHYIEIKDRNDVKGLVKKMIKIKEECGA